MLPMVKKNKRIKANARIVHLNLWGYHGSFTAIEGTADQRATHPILTSTSRNTMGRIVPPIDAPKARTPRAVARLRLNQCDRTATTGPNIAPVAIYATSAPHSFNARKGDMSENQTYSSSKALAEKQLPVFRAFSDEDRGYDQKNTGSEDRDFEPSDVEEATGEDGD